MKEKKQEVLKKTIENISGMKMHDAGMKLSYPPDIVKSSSGSKNNIDYPTLYLNVKQLPELVGYDVEDDVILMIKGKITSHSKNERVGSDGRETFDITIKQIGCKVKEGK